MVGFDGHEASADVRVLIRDYGVGHVILFARNVDEPEQVAELVRELQEIARDAGHDLPLFIGRRPGGRARGAPQGALDGLAATARTGPPRLGEHARRLGEALAAELRACGIRWDFAPVVDVDTNPKNPVIGDRAFSDDPDLVGRLGRRLDPRPRGLGGRRLRQALPRPRRHRPRLAPRPARGQPVAVAPRGRGDAAVPERGRGRGGEGHDRPRDVPGARRGPSRDPLPEDPRPCCERAWATTGSSSRTTSR